MSKTYFFYKIRKNEVYYYSHKRIQSQTRKKLFFQKKN